MDGKVFIVGGGLAGLSAAWALQREGIETEVFEAGEGIGGRAGNRTPAPGFTIDTGAEFFGAFYRTTRTLLRDLGLEGEIVPLRASGALWMAGFAHPFPLSPAAFLTTPLLSWRTKRNLLRIALRLWRTDLSWDTPATAAPFDTESAHAFVTREIGEDYARNVLHPTLNGLTLTPPDRASAGLFLLQVREGMRRPRLFSLRGGIGRLAQVLAREIPVSLRSRVIAVAETKGGCRVVVKKDGERREYQGRGVVIATPAPIALRLLGSTLSLPPFYREVTYARALTLSIGLPTTLPLSASGISEVYPEGGETPALAGIAFLSARGNGQVPPGHEGLAIVAAPQWSEAHFLDPPQRLEGALIAEAQRLLGPLPRPFLWTDRVAHRYGVPIFRTGTYRALAQLPPPCWKGKIALAGDYLESPSIEGAIRSGLTAARLLREAL